MSEIEMEERLCELANCKLPFRVSKGSNQKYHSSYCSFMALDKDKRKEESVRRIKAERSKDILEYRRRKKG